MNITPPSIAIMQARNTFDTHSCHFLQLRQMHVQLKAKSMQRRRVYEACHFGLNKERYCAARRLIVVHYGDGFAPRSSDVRRARTLRHFNLRQLFRSFFSSKNGIAKRCRN